MAEQLNRIHGTEMEFPSSIVQVTTDEQEVVHKKYVQPPHEILQYYFNNYIQTVPSFHEQGNSYLGNGARFYRDINDKYEYATPEDTSFESTAASELISEEVIYNALCRRFSKETGDYKVTGIVVCKRVIDDENHTWGYHESYNTPIKPTYSGEYSLLAAHLATRAVFCGNGYLNPQGIFYIAQKTSQVRSAVHSATTVAEKPLINVRDEALSGNPKLQHNPYGHRFHITSGDPNMSPWATRVKLGTTSLIFRLMEDGQKWGLVFKDKPHVVARDVAKYQTYDQAIRIVGNRRQTAIDISTGLCELAQKYVTEHSVPDEELWALHEWSKVLSDLKADFTRAGDRVDWIARIALLNAARERKGFAWNDPRMIELDRRFDRIGPDSIAKRLREGSWSKWMPSTDLIETRRHTAPQTRAAVRGKIIKALQTSGAIKDMSWVKAKIDGRIYEMPDPRQSQNTAIDEVIKKYEKATGPAG